MTLKAVVSGISRNALRQSFVALGYNVNTARKEVPLDASKPLGTTAERVLLDPLSRIERGQDSVQDRTFLKKALVFDGMNENTARKLATSQTKREDRGKVVSGVTFREQESIMTGHHEILHVVSTMPLDLRGWRILQGGEGAAYVYEKRYRTAKDAKKTGEDAEKAAKAAKAVGAAFGLRVHSGNLRRNGQNAWFSTKVRKDVNPSKVREEVEDFEESYGFEESGGGEGAGERLAAGERLLQALDVRKRLKDAIASTEK